MKTLSGMGIGVLAISLILLGIFWPLVVIWALNTLFAFGIAYTFWTWLAVFVLTLTFGKAHVEVKK